MRRKLFFSIFVPTLLLLAMVATYTNAATPTAEPKGNLVIITHTFGGENWLSPLKPSTQAYISQCMYNNLLERSNETGELIAGDGSLAKRFEMSGDMRTFTFELEKGVPWHGGWGEVTAEDVKFSFDLAVSEGSTNDAAGLYRRYLDRIEIPDPYTVIIRTKVPAWDLQHLLTSTFQQLAIVCKKYVEKVGIEEAGLNPIGSGPFKFVEHLYGDHIKFEAVENHWYKTPRVKYLIWRKIPDVATRLAMLKAGEAHLTQIVYDQIEEARRAGLKVKAVKNSGQLVLLMFGQVLKPAYKPEERPPWAQGEEYWNIDSPAYKVRKALSLAVNRQEIVDTMLYGYGSVKGCSVPAFWPEHPGFDPALKPDAYDPGKAKKLLHEAGYANLKDLVVTMSLTPHGGRPFNKPVAEAVAMMWEKLGITVKTRMESDYPSLIKSTADRTATFAWMWPAPIMADAFTLLNYVTHSDSYASWTGESPELDRLMEKVRESTVLKERFDGQKAIFKYLYEHVPSFPIAYVANLYAMAPNLQWPNKAGAMSGNNLHNFELMYFKE